MQSADPQATARTSRLYAVGQTTLIIVFAGVYFLHPDANLALPAGLPAVGLALCGLGILVVILAFAALGAAIQIAPAPKQGAHLVTHGIYRYLRHPIYTGILLTVAGLWLRQPSILVAVAAVALGVLLVAKARFEEILLAAAYPEYADYKKRAWGVLPGL